MEQQGGEGDRGLKSFLTNVVHNATTVKPVSTPQIDADCAALDAAFKGAGTKEAQLIAVLCTKPKSYIQEVRNVYNHSHTVDLLSKIQLETSGRFQTVLEAMLVTETELRAIHIHKAVAGVGTDEMALIDLIITMDNATVRATKAAYKQHFMIPLQLRVDLDTSGKFQGVLDAILNEKRPDGVQREHVEQDLETLFKATEGKLGTDEKAILNLIASRSPEHLQHLNAAYANRSPKHKTFAEEIQLEISGVFWVQKAFVAAFLGPASWHAWRLHMEMKGLGTDEKALMRSILVPSPAELRAAARILHDIYHEDLAARVNSELWGDAKRALVAYVGHVMTLPDSGVQAFPGPGFHPPGTLPQPKVEHHEAPHHNLSTGQKVGIGVGIGAGVAALAGIGIGLAVHEHQKKEQQQHK
jgi:annexin A7/11